MLVKVVIGFLLAMVLMAMIGRALFPGALRLRRGRAAQTASCPACGRYRIGTQPCDCRSRGRKG